MPITYDNPLSLIKIKDEIIIERLINQLLIKGIKDITIVTGYLADRYKYLEKKFNVKLLFNQAFEESRNITSLMTAQNFLNNTYIINSDIYLKDNIFKSHEEKSWLYFENKQPLGVAFLKEQDSINLIDVVNKEDLMANPNLNWTKILEKTNPHIKSKTKLAVVEINNLDHLRSLDEKLLESLNNEIIETITKVFKVTYNQIENITPLTRGMTNFSFSFKVLDKSYVFRVPGRATDLLIQRNQEAQVYESIKNLNISDEVVYLDPEKGYKITKYYAGTKNLNPYNKEEVVQAVSKIKKLHLENLKVDHSFDILERLEYYKSLCHSVGASFSQDYLSHESGLSLVKDFIKNQDRPKTLCHIDPVAGNFLVLKDKSLKLIDWEYSGMSDPIIDLAMFGISQVYTENQMDVLLNLYFEQRPSIYEKKLFYGYISLASELWYLWTVLKEISGDDYGAYKLQQLTYSKRYLKKFLSLSV